LKKKAVNFSEILARFSEHWSPKIVARMNDCEFRVVKFQGEFVWHSHEETDEAFIVLEGSMTIQLRDGRVDLSEGEMWVVPKGAEHRPSAESVCSALVIETAGTVNTGKTGGDLTTTPDDWT